MEAKVKSLHNWQCLAHMTSHRWLLDFLPKLRDIVRRSPPGSSLYAESGVRFLCVLQCVLMRGWALDASLFFTLVDCIPGPDHSLSMVHRIVSAAREAVGASCMTGGGGSSASAGLAHANAVSPRQLLRYLESRGVVPSPELTAEILTRKKKRIRSVNERNSVKRSLSPKSSVAMASAGNEDDENSAELSPEAAAILTARKVAAIMGKTTGSAGNNRSSGHTSVTFEASDEEEEGLGSGSGSPEHRSSPSPGSSPRDQEKEFGDDG